MGGSRQLYAHGVERLASAGAQPAGVQRVGDLGVALAKMEQGQASEVVAELRRASNKMPQGSESRETLRVEAGYFARNKDAVAYAEYRAKGWSTARSEIESGHKNVVQQRLKISGAWWKPATVDHVLALRMLRHNGWWDDYWDSQRRARSPQAGPDPTRPAPGPAPDPAPGVAPGSVRDHSGASSPRLRASPRRDRAAPYRTDALRPRQGWVQIGLRQAARRREGSCAGMFVWRRDWRPVSRAAARIRSSARDTNGFDWRFTLTQCSWMTA